MGICKSKTKDHVDAQLQGSFAQVINQGPEKNNIEALINEKTQSQELYNPYRNPILNRRLRQSLA
ncbi:unnamed protein product (macronuclear) [Paramecium tetraurelia]|uniref:Uncharacterized protein n=1 Tax=Paramecium tetraurelia TaxID=5888 RepID=A0D3V8_PARTE|nr:uncharacterized protein GSPATT00013190001 [Paramecium tetraurelia]CAK77725.1 unnamed protein product [Paramecium tetraurelia]|eukprot:XP_001445122.1 hypothetical protein (macronuclear) [Paramecium tetraurelia strain d4-2]